MAEVSASKQNASQLAARIIYSNGMNLTVIARFF